MSNTLLRPASAHDNAAIAALLRAMGGHDDVGVAAGLRSLAAVLAAPEYRVIVAERDGSVVGFAALQARTSPLDDRREAWLAALAVTPDLRGDGVGLALLGASEREAARLGCAAIVLESSAWREYAHAFYLANGFTEKPPARRFERGVTPNGTSAIDRFLDAASRAASAIAVAIAGRGAQTSVGIGADDAPTEDADDAAERAAFAELLPLGHPIVSEEAGLVGADAVDPAQPWISLDPLDGSRNFVAAYPAYATSLALVQAGRPLAALVVDLAGNHRWEARANGGATLDGRPIRTRRGPLAAIPSPLPGTTRLRSLPGIERLRIGGSTASDLCRVGDGSLAAFYALDRAVVHVHDLAAAMLVIEEAGGAVVDGAGARPTLVPDARIVLDVVAAADAAYARELAAAT